MGTSGANYQPEKSKPMIDLRPSEIGYRRRIVQIRQKQWDRLRALAPDAASAIEVEEAEIRLLDAEWELEQAEARTS